jgi:hypothetical protein
MKTQFLKGTNNYKVFGHKHQIGATSFGTKSCPTTTHKPFTPMNHMKPPSSAIER